MAASSRAIVCASSQILLSLPLICSSNSGRVEREENTVDVTSSLYSTPSTAGHATVEDEFERLYIGSEMSQVI